MLIILLGSDSLFYVENIKNAANDKYLNGSSVQVTLYKSDGTTEIAGETWPKAMTYKAGSNGRYECTFEDGLTLTGIDTGKAKIEVDASADPNGSADLIRTTWESVVFKDDENNFRT